MHTLRLATSLVRARARGRVRVRVRVRVGVGVRVRVRVRVRGRGRGRGRLTSVARLHEEALTRASPVPVAEVVEEEHGRRVGPRQQGAHDALHGEAVARCERQARRAAP